MDDAPLRAKVDELLKNALAPRGNKESLFEEMSAGMVEATLKRMAQLRKNNDTFSVADTAIVALCEGLAKSSMLLLIQGKIHAKLLSIAFDSFEGDAWAKAMKEINSLTLDDLNLAGASVI